VFVFRIHTINKLITDNASTAIGLQATAESRRDNYGRRKMATTRTRLARAQTSWQSERATSSMCQMASDICVIITVMWLLTAIQCHQMSL